MTIRSTWSDAIIRTPMIQLAKPATPIDAMLVLAGFLFGLAIFARPFDAVLFSLPFFALLAWNFRNRLQAGVRGGAWLVIGASAPLTAMALYFQRTTGSVSELPFQVLDPADTVGFGSRRIFPGAPYVDFDFSLAVDALLAQLHLLVVWSCGGVLLVALAVRAMRRPRRGAMVATAAAAATTVGGYFFFWGGVNALSWGGLFQLGPWYTMPALVPLCVLGARGLQATGCAQPPKRHAGGRLHGRLLRRRVLGRRR